jgi:hypothetical protein
VNLFTFLLVIVKSAWSGVPLIVTGQEEWLTMLAQPDKNAAAVIAAHALLWHCLMLLDYAVFVFQVDEGLKHNTPRSRMQAPLFPAKSSPPRRPQIRFRRELAKPNARPHLKATEQRSEECPPGSPGFVVPEKRSEQVLIAERLQNVHWNAPRALELVIERHRFPGLGLPPPDLPRCKPSKP